MPSPDRRVERALLLTDVVDSTKLIERLGDQRAAAMWGAHDRAARDLLVQHDGLEIDKTDGFLLMFESVDAAAGYAIAWHAALRRLSAELGIGLAARAGLHFGEVVLRENPADDVARGAKPLEVEGIAKPLAARVMSVATGEQTLVSAAARAQLELDCAVRSHGFWRMKGVDQPVELFEVSDADSPFLPPPDGAKVYRVVRDGEGWRPAREVPNNLPVRSDSFLGRAAELRELGERLGEDGAIVTLLGPGGTGKTRLCLEFAKATLGDWPGGAWFVELEDVRAADALTAALASVFGIRLEGADPVAWLAGLVAERGPTLVVLDNFEQLVEQGAAVIERFAELAPQVGWMVSSREPLRIAGEQILRLDALSLPAQGASFDVISASDAVCLFVQRASATGRFKLWEGNAADVAELVRLLDGMPLAIELAAARASVMAPAKLVQRMSQRFKLLAKGRRGARPRQATLRGAIDWSWDLLEPVERYALAQCSVFRGGFTLEAAEEVLDLSPWPEAPWAMDVVQALMDKSLLRTWSPDAGADRAELSDPLFGMYVSIQEYTTEKLRDPAAVEGPEGPVTGAEAEQQCRLRHAQHYGADPCDRADEALESPEGLARLVLERENTSVALESALAEGDAELCASCWLLLAMVANRRGPASGAAASFGRLDLDAVEDLDLVDRVLKESLDLHRRLGQSELERSSAQALAALRRSRGDLAGEIDARGAVIRSGVWADRAAGRAALQELLEEARPVCDEELLMRLQHDIAISSRDMEETRAALELLSQHNDSRLGAMAAYNLGCANLGLGRYDAVRATSDQVLAWAEARGGRLFEMLGWNNQAQALAMAGDWEQARPLLERVLQTATELEERRWQYGGPCLVLTLAELEAGELDAARARIDRALPLQRALGDPHELCWALAVAAETRAAAGDTDGARGFLEEADRLAPGLKDEREHISFWIRRAWARLEG